METRHRIIWGALGGISPSLVSLLSFNFHEVAEFVPLTWLGLGVRALILAGLGALVAALYKSEMEPIKVFQLGVAAPALLATFANTGMSAGGASEAPTRVDGAAPTAEVGFFIASANASEFANDGYLRKPSSKTSDFIYGLIGRSSASDWFVIAGSHRSKTDANAQRVALRAAGYNAWVYEPYAGSAYYSVAIAANVSRKEAKRLLAQALDDGLPDDSYLWTFR